MVAKNHLKKKLVKSLQKCAICSIKYYMYYFWFYIYSPDDMIFGENIPISSEFSI